MSINAVKGVEIGDGFAAAAMRGEDAHDDVRLGNEGGGNEGGGNAGEGVRFLANHAGGVLGGISTGPHLVARFAVNPPLSILGPPRPDTATPDDIAAITTGPHHHSARTRPVTPSEALNATGLADQL